MSNNQIHAPSHYFNLEKSVRGVVPTGAVEGEGTPELQSQETYIPPPPPPPVLIPDPFSRLPNPETSPSTPYRSSYFNLFWCMNVWVSFSNSASLHLIKGSSDPSTHLSPTLPASPPPATSSLGSSSPGLGPLSSPASWPVPPYKKATHRQEVTASPGTPFSASFPSLAGPPPSGPPLAACPYPQTRGHHHPYHTGVPTV